MTRQLQKRIIAAPPLRTVLRPGTTDVSANSSIGKLNVVSKPPNIIEHVHASGKQFVVAVTGGGSGSISALLQVPGASASVLEAIVPYAATALVDWLGGRPDQFCSERIARAMAMAAFERARELSDADPHILRGIGATASLASNRAKRGPRRIHVAWQSAETTTAASLVLSGKDSRPAEEVIATDLILRAVADACGIEQGLSIETSRDSVELREQYAPHEWTELLLGARRTVFIGTPAVGSPTKLIFPGAFNPPHSGHKRMVQVAAERFGVPVTREMSIANVDKPKLDFLEIADRLSQLNDEPVLLTSAPTFVEKADLVPGCVFIVGVDTLVRIGDDVYYGGDPTKRDAAIEKIARCGCRFLVFGRIVDLRFCSLADCDVPPSLRALCDEVPESMFREDVSSTELRRT